MNKFEEWFMNRIIQREVSRPGMPREHIINLYRMIRIKCEHEFYEDNTVTMNSNLREWFEKSLRNPTK
jgi:hypothetical protein